MLQNLVEYLIENPNIKEKVKECSVSLVGLTKMEQQAVIDSFEDEPSVVGPLQFW
ncbi:competence protein [Desulfosporosinus sp. HMP52]|uniref:competence pheromone ComX n=1 Tax=Desulfosporosinus sp. HMP52 TaxID=1487923 RepID=UPI00051F9179|nr:competence pheromone ComX [Desulfosporosinus sp. HMP52]KGK86868.1 competence protein [Desulfosporosinus sp. HMP52]